jgi:hypothetical protein
MGKTLKLLKKEAKLERKYSYLHEEFVNGKDCGQEMLAIRKKLKRIDRKIVRAIREELNERLGDRYEVHVFDTTWM